MEKRELTIHRALAELKLIDAKLAKAMNDTTPFVSFKNADGLVDGIIKEDDFAKAVKSNYQRYMDLIDNRESIKSAITKSNNTTIVKVGDKEMTVIDAVNYRNIISIKRQVLDKLIKQNNKAVSTIQNRNERVDKEALSLAEKALGSETINSDDKKVESIIKPYREANYYKLADPLECSKKIEDLFNEITKFEAEIDAVLSESNAVTKVEF